MACKYNNHELSHKIQAGLIRIKHNTKGISRVWIVFGLLEDLDGNLYKGYIGCRECFTVIKHRQNCTSNLLRHKCVKKKSLTGKKSQVSGQHKSIIKKAIIKWCIKDMIPFSKVDGEGFVSMISDICSVVHNYKTDPVDVEQMLPHATSISKEINHERGKYDPLIRTHIQSALHYSVSIDILSYSSGNTFLSITLRYIVENNFFERLLAVRNFEQKDQTDDDTIKSIIESVLDIYTVNISKCTFVAVTDNICPSGHRFDCNVQVLHNILQTAIKAVPEIDILLEKCASLLKSIKNSAHLSLQLSDVLKSEAGDSRWNSTYTMIDTICSNWNQIENCLMQSNCGQPIPDINLNLLSSLWEFLRSFNDASVKMEEGKSPTLHLVIPLYDLLRELCVDRYKGCELFRFKAEVEHLIKTIWLPKMKMEHRVALFLYPPCNSLLTFSEKQRDEVKHFIVQTYNNIVQLSSLSEIKPELIIEDDTISENFREFQRYRPRPATRTLENSVIDEINKYKLENVEIDMDFNIVEWWNSHKESYNKLYTIFVKILCIPAASSSEAILSIANDNSFIEKSNLSTQNLDSILVLRSNMEADNYEFEEREAPTIIPPTKAEPS